MQCGRHAGARLGMWVCVWGACWEWRVSAARRLTSIAVSLVWSFLTLLYTYLAPGGGFRDRRYVYVLSFRCVLSIGTGLPIMFLRVESACAALRPLLSRYLIFLSYLSYSIPPILSLV